MELKDLLRGDASKDLYKPAHLFYQHGKIPKSPRLTIKGYCQWCGKQIFSNKDFCSPECEKSFKEILPQKISLKHSIKYRDKFICQKCGRDLADRNIHNVRIPVASKGELHHKVFVIDGGTTTPENLILLCHKCHEEYHKNDKVELTFKKNTYSFDDLQQLKQFTNRIKDKRFLEIMNLTEGMFPEILRLIGVNEFDPSFDSKRPLENIFQTYGAYTCIFILWEMPNFLEEIKSLPFEIENFSERTFGGVWEAYKTIFDRMWNIKNVEQFKTFLRYYQKTIMDLSQWMVMNAYNCLKPENHKDLRMFLANQFNSQKQVYDYDGYSNEMLFFIDFCYNLTSNKPIQMVDQNGNVRTWSVVKKKKNKPKRMIGNKLK